MIKKRWSDLTVNQKAKGIALIREQTDFLLNDEDGNVIDETDQVFLKRLSEEHFYELAIGLYRNKEARKVRESITDL